MASEKLFTEVFIRYPGFKTKAVTLSYDDGTVHDRRMIEALNRYGLKCTFNLNSGTIGKPGKVSREEMVTLYAGHETAVHTLTHPHLNNLSLGQIAYQVTEDRKNLEEIFQRPVEGMAYPFGLTETPGQVDAFRSCGIRYARTTVSTHGFSLPTDPLRWNPTCHHADPKLPELVNTFLQPDDMEHPWRITCKLLYVWGHSYEFDGKWEDLESVCRLLSGHDEVWYATNGEIIDYLEAYRRLRSTVDGRYLYNPSAASLYLHVADSDIIVEPGQTIHL